MDFHVVIKQYLAIKTPLLNGIIYVNSTNTNIYLFSFYLYHLY